MTERYERMSRKPVRLWPGVVAVILQWVGWVILPAVVPEWAALGILCAGFFGLVIALWLLFFSRAPWLDRLGALVVMIAAVAATTRLVHESIANGMMGFMPFIYAIPALSLALVVWAVATRGFSTRVRRASMVAAMALACAPLTVIRTDGITGDADSDLAWRWTPTAEQRLLAQGADDPSAPPDPAVTQPEGLAPSSVEPESRVSTTAPTVSPGKPTPDEGDRLPGTSSLESAGTIRAAEWPGFRGPERDSVVRGVRIDTDWSRSVPVELWRRPVGPGWSSFAVSGDVFFTQEQRGDDEVVSAYRLHTGEPVWRHRDPARFWESNAGAGPRATPTLAHGRVYTLGGTGILNALDARSGSVIWSRNAASDTGREIPDWGISSSPLVVGDLVIAAASGWLVAYDAATGTPRWFGPKHGGGYSSPHLATIGGVPQIVLVTGLGAVGVSPSDGTALWKHPVEGAAIVQPAVVPGGDLLVAGGAGLPTESGLQRVTVAHEPGGWVAKERWASRGLKPYFNDFVVHKGLAFGFDGSILACIGLEDGARKWKGGRYGHGQLVLLPDQDVLLVLSEEGELALVRATPDQFTELARFKAIEGKTWNHPVLVGDLLLVRNGEEMAAFRLVLAGARQ